ncbi:MAG: histidine kinase [Butyricicoccus sp.]|nr:histidine kinase [Butyricicoccus sp.]
MKKRPAISFKGRLFAAFLLASLVPLLICSAMLLQIFRLRMTEDDAADADERLGSISAALDSACSSFGSAREAIGLDNLILSALSGGEAEDTRVYTRLFEHTGQTRGFARFDLYDAGGQRRYSTRSGGLDDELPTAWGILGKAVGSDELVFLACDGSDDPLLQGAAALYLPDGNTAGYLVISLYQSDFYTLLEGKYGAQCTLLLLDPYWRGVYCTQPALGQALAGELRSRLLAGQSLDGAQGDFLYSVALHEQTGLYLVLQRAQVFNRETVALLYTVSLSCALAGVLVSVLLSLSLSRQMFRPIGQLRAGIREVERGNLDISLTLSRRDELGELSRHFNSMVAALKHNQQQLLENQRELNQAQIRMLQAQLNPHFLCNTLDTMKWISKINKVPQVALMSTDLADILRFCISPEEFVPLGREMEILQRYIEIQRIRLSGAVSFSAELPEELAGCLVPKMILQPVVENAILHGLDGVENGEVDIRADAAPKGLLIVVSDNGHGLPPEMEGRYRENFPSGVPGHLGLYNVDTILLKYYGEDYGLELRNRPGGGAEVTAALPARGKERGE